MITPDILKGWVAEPAQSPTEVIKPCHIDPSAMTDLVLWHPGFDSSRKHRFMHVAADDGDGKGPYVRTDPGSLSNNWKQEMRAVMVALKLRPFPTGSNDPAPMLIDDSIGQLDTPLMHDWKVTHWMVVRNVDTAPQLVHQDLITWQHTSGKVVKSMFTWRPYLSVPLQPQPQSQSLKGMVRNERANVEVTPAR